MSKKQEYLIIAGLLVLIFPFFALLFYVHPQGDDFFFAAKVNELGVLGFVKDMYFHWSGRYASMFIGAFDPLRFESIILFRFSLLFFQLLFISSIFTLLRSLIVKDVSHSKILFFTLAFYAVFFNSVPDIYEFTYWLPSVSAYVFGISLFNFFISNYLLLLTHKLSSNLYVIINSILAIIIIGLNEIFIIPLLITILSLSIKKTSAFSRNKMNLNLPILIVIIISSIVVITAPGNYIRMEGSHNYARIIQSIITTTRSIIFVVGFFLQNILFILSSAVFIFILIYIDAPNFKNRINLINLNPILSISASLIGLFIILFPVVYSIRILPLERVLDFLSYIFIILWILNLIILAKHYNKKSILYSKSRLISILVIISLLLLISGQVIVFKYKFSKSSKDYDYIFGNILNAYSTLFFKAKSYDMENQLQTKRFQDAQLIAKDTLWISPFYTHPKILLYRDFNNFNNYNESYWFNGWENRYYGIDSIYIIINDKEKDN